MQKNWRDGKLRIQGNWRSRETLEKILDKILELFVAVANTLVVGLRFCTVDRTAILLT